MRFAVTKYIRATNVARYSKEIDEQFLTGRRSEWHGIYPPPPRTSPRPLHEPRTLPVRSVRGASRRGATPPPPPLVLVIPIGCRAWPSPTNRPIQTPAATLHAMDANTPASDGVKKTRMRGILMRSTTLYSMSGNNNLTRDTEMQSRCV
nr:unnamed protein product [Digitaria exilis]